MSLTKHSVTVEIGGRPMIFEAGHIARQAHGACTVRMGDTMVFAATVEGPDSKYGEETAALTVDYREKTYAAGKFPGGFIKREGRPTTKEILTCRLIDRPLRPLFPDGYCKEVAVNAMALSADNQFDPDVLAMNASFAATSISGLPIADDIAAVRVGYVDGGYVVNPTQQEMEASQLDIIIAGSRKGVTMVESGSEELSEEIVLGAIKYGWQELQAILDGLEKLRKLCGKPQTWVAPEADPKDVELHDKIRKSHREAMLKAHHTRAKRERGVNLKKVKEEIKAAYFDAEAETPTYTEKQIGKAWDKILSDIIRTEALAGRRSDGRGLTDIRPISCEVGVLPRTHGSAMFTRGETQAMVIVTLGVGKDAQIVDGLGEEYEMDFYLHYNFPSYSVGESWPNRGPKRREFGHGALAERALRTLVPPKEEFPYTVRVVSEIMESNGSSSMATVCGGTLALLDAGVKVPRPVAGIAMGLIQEGKKVAVLSDILGSEDHDGDMDFKVAGTADGITALQMDIKIFNLSFEVMETALNQAREGRRFILEQMAKVIDAPRAQLSPYAPRLETVRINPEKIGMVIGPGGKMVRGIQERTNTVIEIDDDGTVTISGTEAAGVESAKAEIEAMTQEAVIGQTYDGRVTGITDFGCFLEIIPGQEGLLHVSEWSYDYTSNIGEFVKKDDIVKVKVIDIEANGKMRLSRRALMERPANYVERERKPHGGGGDRGGRDRGGHRGGGRHR